MLTSQVTYYGICFRYNVAYWLLPFYVSINGSTSTVEAQHIADPDISFRHRAAVSVLHYVQWPDYRPLRPYDTGPKFGCLSKRDFVSFFQLHLVSC